jgi:hypothetical protein
VCVDAEGDEDESAGEVNYTNSLVRRVSRPSRSDHTVWLWGASSMSPCSLNVPSCFRAKCTSDPALHEQVDERLLNTTEGDVKVCRMPAFGIQLAMVEERRHKVA